MSKINEINSKEELNTILSLEKGIILLNFSAPWCGPCRTLAPTLQEIANEVDDITVVKVNVDDNPKLSTEYGVRNIPVVFAIKDNEQLDKFVGNKNKDGIMSFIENLKIKCADETKK